MCLNRCCVLGGLLGVFLIFFSPHLGFAQFEVEDLPGNIHLGPVRVHPQFGIREVYTDNFFVDAANEKDNWTTILIPGIVLQVPFRQHMLQLDYRSEIYRHSDFSRYDTEEHYAGGLLDLKFPWGLELKIGDAYRQAMVPPDFDGDTKDDYHYNQAIVEASYELRKRYRVKVGYRNAFREFWERANEVDNFVLNEGSFDLYYRIMPRTHFLLEYTFLYLLPRG